MEKDFDAWNIQKKITHHSEMSGVFHEREIWWAKIGMNIGVEIGGRHELFLRPVIVIKKFNKDMTLVIPTTSQDKINKYYFDIAGVNGKTYTACLSHIKTISSKRLFRKMDIISAETRFLLIEKIITVIRGFL